MKEFNFGKAPNFQVANVLTVNFVASFFQGFGIAFKNVFFPEQLSLAASVSLLKQVSCSLPEVTYSKGSEDIWNIS